MYKFTRKGVKFEVSHEVLKGCAKLGFDPVKILKKVIDEQVKK